jgi:long-chain acyl-CoA synthetase
MGEIVVRGDLVMKGYWNKPEATAETLRGGWLHTGDIGYMDEDGYLYITDRKKDMIISGGSNIYPREIEEVICRRHLASCKKPQSVEFLPALPKNACGKVLKRERRDRFWADRTRRV